MKFCKNAHPKLTSFLKIDSAKFSLQSFKKSSYTRNNKILIILIIKPVSASWSDNKAFML